MIAILQYIIIFHGTKSVNKVCFLGMNKTCFLLLGKGIPEGDTAYVLTIEESGEHWLWNPVTRNA